MTLTSLSEKEILLTFMSPSFASKNGGGGGGGEEIHLRSDLASD